MKARVLLACVIVTLAALPAAGQSVKLSFHGGKVDLSAENASIRTILTEESLRIVVSGNPGRNQSRAYISNHAQGPPITRRVATG